MSASSNKYHRTYDRDAAHLIMQYLRNTVIFSEEGQSGKTVNTTYGQWLDKCSPDTAYYRHQVVKALVDVHLNEGPLKQVRTKKWAYGELPKNVVDILDQTIRELVPEMCQERGR